MTDLERIAKLRATANDLGIRLHLISTNLETTDEVTPTKCVSFFGIATITNLATDGEAFYLQQLRYLGGKPDERAE